MPKTISSSPYNTICKYFYRIPHLSLVSWQYGTLSVYMLLPTAQFRHVTLTARRSRLALHWLSNPASTWTQATSLSNLLTLLFLVCSLWTATSGGVNPRAMGAEGTNRCNVYSSLQTQKTGWHRQKKYGITSPKVNSTCNKKLNHNIVTCKTIKFFFQPMK
jgi:hypothetical protein